MSYVRKLGASALVIAAAFAVAFAVLVSSPTQTVEAQAAPDHTLATGANNVDDVAPGDTVRIVVGGAFAQVSITGTADGVGGSFDANEGQSIACGNDATCDEDDADTTVSVDLTVDADSGEGHILLSVGGLGATTATKVINVSKTNLVGSLSITASPTTISAADGTSTLTILVKDAQATPEGENGEEVTLVTTLGTLECVTDTETQACSVTTADSSGVANVDDGTPGYATVTLNGKGVEGTATITARLGSFTDTATVTLFGTAKNLTAEPDQGSIEIGGEVYIVLTVTDAAGNPVAGQMVRPVTSPAKEVEGPEGVDNPVLVVTTKNTGGDSTATPPVPDGRGYSSDKPAAGSAKAIPACGDDNAHIGEAAATYDELFGSDDADGTSDDGEGTNANGQCVVLVTAPEDTSDATKNATRGEHTLNFQISATVKASATIEVAGKPSSITTDAPAMVDTASVTEITVSVWDDEDVLVGITDVKVRKVGGDGLIEDESGTDMAGNATPGVEKTSDGQSKFTFIAPSAIGSSEILITAGDAETRITLQIGEEPAPEPEPEPAPHVPALNRAPSATGFSLVTFNGGSVAELGDVLTAACGDDVRAWATDYTGGYVLYAPTAPALVNSSFNALFSDSVPAGEPLLVSCGG